MDNLAVALGAKSEQMYAAAQKVMDDVSANAESFDTNQLKLPMDRMMDHLAKCSTHYQTLWFHRVALNDLNAFHELHKDGLKM